MRRSGKMAPHSPFRGIYRSVVHCARDVPSAARRYAGQETCPGMAGGAMWQRRDRRRRAKASEQDRQGVRDGFDGLVVFHREALGHVRIDVQLPENGATPADQDDQF